MYPLQHNTVYIWICPQKNSRPTSSNKPTIVQKLWSDKKEPDLTDLSQKKSESFGENWRNGGRFSKFIFTNWSKWNNLASKSNHIFLHFLAHIKAHLGAHFNHPNLLTDCKFCNPGTTLHPSCSVANLFKLYTCIKVIEIIGFHFKNC